MMLMSLKDYLEHLVLVQVHMQVCLQHIQEAILSIGPKKSKLFIRRVRLAEDRIIINDDGKLTQHLVQLPSFEQVVDFVSPNAARVMKMNFGQYSSRKINMLDS